MERFIQTQSKTNEALGEFVSQLNAKFKSMSTYQKMMENQLAQIAQQVTHISRPQGHLSGQPETNPKRQMNAISLKSGKTLEGSKEACKMGDDQVVDDQEAKIVGEEEGKHEEGEPSSPHVNIKPKPVEPYKPPIPLLQRLAKAKLEA